MLSMSRMCTAWVEAVHTGTQAAGPAPPQFPPPAPLCGRRRVPLGFLDPPGMAEKLAVNSLTGLKAESPKAGCGQGHTLL